MDQGNTHLAQGDAEGDAHASAAQAYSTLNSLANIISGTGGHPQGEQPSGGEQPAEDENQGAKQEPRRRRAARCLPTGRGAAARPESPESPTRPFGRSPRAPLRPKKSLKINKSFPLLLQTTASEPPSA